MRPGAVLRVAIAAVGLSVLSVAWPAVTRADAAPSLANPQPTTTDPAVAPQASSLPFATAPVKAPAANATGTEGPTGGEGAEPTLKAGPVRVAGEVVFTLRAELAGMPPTERAQQASKAILQVISDTKDAAVSVRQQGQRLVISAGDTPIVQLSAADAQLENTELPVYGDQVAAEIRRVIASEQQRSSVAKTVFSISLSVFLGLVVILLGRRLRGWIERAQSWVEQNEKSLAVRIRQIELLGPEMVQTALLTVLSSLVWIARIGLLYTWLVITLSLFDATSGYTARLTGFVVTPLSQLAGRVVASLPILLLAALVSMVVLLLVRFVRIFMTSVARRETTLSWVPADLALPASIILRAAIVIAALVFIAPLVTGDSDGSFTNAGLIALGALAFAATPLLANAVVGAVVVFGRRLKLREHVEIGATRGRIVGINLLEIAVEGSDRTLVRVPHLSLLRTQLKMLGVMPRVSIEVSVGTGASHPEIDAVLTEAAATVGTEERVELLDADADGLHYRVTATCATLDARAALVGAVVSALKAKGFSLGRRVGARANDTRS